MIKLVMKIVAVVGIIVFYFMFGRGIFFLLFGSGKLDLTRILITPILGGLVTYAFVRGIIKRSFAKTKINSSFQKKYPTLESETYNTASWTIMGVMLLDFVVGLFFLFQ
ncbi:hypothetical protein HY085_03090 [Candidatus Gottesmanbacteria bacterium]|nr:hypothetical protein [Candidatus Gottesmanbacteria bacterium]